MEGRTGTSEALAAELGLPFIALSRYYPMPEALRLLPRAAAERLGLVPLALTEEGALLVATSDPLNLLAQDEVRMMTGRVLKLAVAAPEDIRENLDRLYSLQDSLEDAIVEIQSSARAAPEEAVERTEDAPVIQLVNRLIRQAVREGASDIHIEALEGVGRVRFRVDGKLYTPFEYPRELHPSLTSRIKIISGMDIAERRRPQDGRVLATLEGREIDLRVSVLPASLGETAVLRVLDRESGPAGLEGLGLDPEGREQVEAFCDLPWGIVLATGPTGSGKSTTLHAMLQRLNRPDVNIVTVEDPVELSLSGVNQVQVNEKVGLTFNTALRSILRQDPDVIMVGEIRDQETAQTAIRAALTGHLVLSTLHTNDAPSAATRLIEMGVPAFLVAASLSGLIAQRLVRRLCPRCREEYELDVRTCRAIGVPEGTRAFRPGGCAECREGYRGRQGIFEIMALDDALRRMILDGASSVALRQAAAERGMRSLRAAGIAAALSGSTSLEEVLSVTL